MSRTAGRGTVRGRFLVGADGPRSTVRQQLGWRYTGESGVQRDFMGGRMYAIYLRSPQFYAAVPHAPAWMNVSFNRDRRAFMAAIDGRGEFAFHTQLRAGEREEDAVRGRRAGDVPGGRRRRGAGRDPVAPDLDRGALPGRRGFQQGRVFIGGDAAHLFTPTGGLGYNTAVEDAVNLGWKLAAVIRGQASARLLDTYEQERRPVALRNTAYARRFADSLGLFEPDRRSSPTAAEGEAARLRAGEYLAAHGRLEFDIPGVTFGARYDGSAAIVADGTEPPPDAANRYMPSACPGGRAPHLWLGERESLYDRFGFEWTLLRLGGEADNAQPFVDAAARRGLPLQLVDLDDAPAPAALYAADLALIRPDQVVAWRGGGANAADAVLGKLLGDDESEPAKLPN